MSSSIVTNERGCGRRKKGGVYAECPTGPGGMPINYFLRCLPIIVEDASGRMVIDSDHGPIEITPRGVSLVEINGVCHVFDFVGAENYPNVEDFVREAAILGVSRRLELEAGDYARLSRLSNLVLVHSRAWIENSAAYYEAMSEKERSFFECPRAHEPHKIGDREKGCAGLWRHDLESITEREPITDEKDFDRVMGGREIPCGAIYAGYERPKNIRPAYKAAVFAAFPIKNIAVINDDTTAKSHMSKLAKMQGCSLPVEIKED